MTSQPPIRLGISTCPNDTFAFAALIERRVNMRGLTFDVELLDIQQLNDRLLAGDFDVSKTSFHAALSLTDQTVVLPSGSALGFGVGPLLLASQPNTSPTSIDQVTLCPGFLTTATLLFRLFYGGTTSIEQAVFSDIMPRLQTASADFGVCIHEGRFTWQIEGLHLVEDLGTRWERETSSPLPLGGIVARRALDGQRGDETIGKVQAVIRDSISAARRDPDSALPMMRRHAQEFADEVLMQHVNLYVNDWTVDLGDAGRAALAKLSAMAGTIGLMPPEMPPIEVWSGQ